MSQLSPFDLLRSIAQASVASAAGLPAQAQVQQFWTGVAFKFAGYSLVAAMSDVSEIISIPAITQIARVKPWVGVANVRGRLIPVMDLAGFCGLDKQEQKNKQQRLLIVEHQDILNGLIVDDVDGMQQFVSEGFDQQQQSAPLPLQQFVEGSYQKNQQSWTVLQVKQLISSPAFMQVAV